MQGEGGPSLSLHGALNHLLSLARAGVTVILLKNAFCKSFNFFFFKVSSCFTTRKWDVLSFGFILDV